MMKVMTIGTVKRICTFTIIFLFNIYAAKSAKHLSINGKIEAPNHTFENTRIFISGRQRQIKPNSSGSFRIPNLSVGNYLLKIIDSELVYDMYEIQVFEQNSDEGNELSFKSFVFDVLSGMPGKGIPGNNNLYIRPLYSTKKKDGSELISTIFSLFKNPLVVITLISLCITFALPFLQDSLDAEAMEEITGSIPGGNYVSSFLNKIS